MSVAIQEKERVWTPGLELVHWVNTQQLPIIRIFKYLKWKEAVRLAATSPQLWPHVERLVTLARPNQNQALAADTPDRLRIPLLTGLTHTQVAEHNYRVFREAYIYGYFATAQWLEEQFQLTGENAQVPAKCVLPLVCRDYHLAAAQWLTERFQLTAEEVRDNENAVLRYACMSGRVELVQWLVERFGLTAEDAQDRDNAPMRIVCKYGHLALAQWLADRFGLATENGEDFDEWTLYHACRNGHLKMVQWLAERHRLTVEHIRKRCVFGLHEAYRHRHLLVWFEERFGITEGEIVELRRRQLHGYQ